MIPLAQIRAAAGRLAGKVHRTPLLPATALGDRAGVRLHLKCESFQKTGSFKPRGALNKVLSLSPEERARGLVTVSAGNHAQALAWAARIAGAACTVVMPSGAPQSKIDATRGYGAEIVLHDDRATLFDRLAEVRDSRGLAFVPPFDDPDVIAGAGTVGLEIVEDLPDVDVVVVPVGGGGVIAGIASAVKQLRPRVHVVGVELAEGHAGRRNDSAVRGRPSPGDRERGGGPGRRGFGGRDHRRDEAPDDAGEALRRGGGRRRDRRPSRRNTSRAFRRAGRRPRLRGQRGPFPHPPRLSFEVPCERDFVVASPLG